MIPALALTLALSAAASASARLELNPLSGAAQPSASVSTNICSEVCGAGGYTAAGHATVAKGATLPHDPRARSVALAGGTAGAPSSTVANSQFSGPRSEVVSGGGYTNPASVPTTVRVVAPSSGFDWGDAGIGAGGAFALMLLVGGVAGSANLRHRVTRSTAQPTT